MKKQFPLLILASGNIELPTTVINNGVNYTVTSIGDSAFWLCDELIGDLVITPINSP